MGIINTLSAEQSKILATMLDQKYGGQLGSRFFNVEGHKDGNVVTVRVTLRDAKGTFTYPVEARIETGEQDLTTTEARDLLLDYIDAYFDEFLNGGEETYLTIDWSNYDCDGLDLQMRGQILNTHLESLADKIIEGEAISLEQVTGKILN